MSFWALKMSQLIFKHYIVLVWSVYFLFRSSSCQTFRRPLLYSFSIQINAVWQSSALPKVYLNFKIQSSMVQLRKIVNIILFLFLLPPLYGQNRYSIPGVYYNMDTTNCLYEERINLDTVDIKDHSARMRELMPYRPILMRRLSVPIVVMRDSSVIQVIDSMIAISSDNDYTMFPDTSGYYMDLAFYNPMAYRKYLALDITPTPNYLMSEILFPIGYEILLEWDGECESSAIGCFFYKDILCLVRKYAGSTWSPQCQYYETGESIQLNLFKPEFRYWKEFFPPTESIIFPLCK